MDIDKILTLVENGFTADEIRAIEKATLIKEPPKADDEDHRPEPKEAPPTEKTDIERLMETMTQSINDLKSTITATMARTTETDGPGRETTDDILAEMIRPTFKSKR